MTRMTAILTLLAAAGMASAADIPEPDLCTVEIDALAIGASIFVVPDGSGTPLTAASAPGGVEVDATITVTLVNPAGELIVGYPAEDLWLETADGGLVACPDGTTADAPTDENGQTVWQQPLHAGGWSDAESLLALVAGVPIHPELPLRVNSPDVNGDLEVNLSDIVPLAQALGGYAYEVDFNHDGAINLSDIARFVPAIGAACP
ncbi:hypothetical protein GF314_13505 [bacterium]|nr:hypothetical protein [bacterium]